MVRNKHPENKTAEKRNDQAAQGGAHNAFGFTGDEFQIGLKSGQQEKEHDAHEA